MKKIIIILISFLSIQNVSFSMSNFDVDNNYVYKEEQKKLTPDKVVKDVNEIKTKIDTTISNGKKIIDILRTSIENYGIKRAMQIHSSFFIPIIIFGILFLLFLRKRKI